MEHTGHRRRLRQRFDENQLNGFSEHEVLELLLTYAIPRMDVNPLAHRLIRRFGSLNDVLDATAEELKTVEGMGDRSAALLTMIVPLMRHYEQKRVQPRLRISTFSKLASYVSTLFVGMNDEHFYLLCFDAKLQLTKTMELACGTVDEVYITPKQVVQEALRNHAVSVAIAHNHPSGDSNPSMADMELTKAIRDALKTVDIKLLDHIIVGRLDTFSVINCCMQDKGMGRSGYLAAEENEMKGRPRAGNMVWEEENDWL